MSFSNDAEDVPKRSVPDGVLFMTATVDVQGGKSRRFVVQVTGYGEQGEMAGRSLQHTPVSAGKRAR